MHIILARLRDYFSRGLLATFVPLTGADFSSAKVEAAPWLTKAFTAGSLPDFLNAAFQAAISVGAMLAVLRIAYAGFLYMTTESFGEKGAARRILGNTVLGLLLLLSIWIILNLINPNILNLNFLSGVTPPSKSTDFTTGGSF